MDIIKPRIMKGTRDFLPDDMRVREHVIGIIKKRFETYGFAPLATPAMEYYDILTGKYGDEGDKGLFKILNTGDFLAGADEIVLDDILGGAFGNVNAIRPVAGDHISGYLVVCSSAAEEDSTAVIPQR